MRGDSLSVGNVQEVGRIMRLEKLRADFYRGIAMMATIAVASAALYHSLVSSRPEVSMEQPSHIVFSNDDKSAASPMILYQRLSSFISESKYIITYSLIFTSQKYRDTVTIGFYSIIFIIMSWLVIGVVSLYFTSNASILSTSQLKKLGLNTSRLSRIASPIPSISSVKKTSAFESNRVQSSSLVSSLASPVASIRSNDDADRGFSLARSPPTTSIMQSWGSPVPNTVNTPVWQQYNASPPLSGSNYIANPVMDDLSAAGKTFDAFTSLRMHPLAVTDDHKDNLKRLIIRYLRECIMMFDSISEKIADALVSSGKLGSIGVDRALAVRVLSLQEFHVGKLTHLLEMCKETFLVTAYGRSSSSHVELVTEYLCLLHIFDLSYLSTAQHTLSLDALKAAEVRRFADDRAHWDGYSSDVTEQEMLVYIFFHIVQFSRLSQSDSKLLVECFFRVADPSKMNMRFSLQRYSNGTANLPRVTTSQASPHHIHSPLRGLLNVQNIICKAGHLVGILCQKARGSGKSNELPHFSLYLPPGVGHSFVTILVLDKGRQNCLTCLILFLLVYYQSSLGVDVTVSHNSSTIVTRILAEVFSVNEVSGLKSAVASMGMHIL